RVGITFVHEVREKTGLSAADVARAYSISREVFDVRSLYDAIEGLDNVVPAALQIAMLTECGRLIERASVWFLRQAAQPLDIAHEIATYRDGVKEITEHLLPLLSQGNADTVRDRTAKLVADGVPEDLALRAASLPFLMPACDIVRIAHGAGQPVLDIARVYFAIGTRFGFDWLRAAAARLPSDNAWDKLAVSAIVDDLYGHQSELTARVVEGTEELSAPDTVIEHWAAARRSLVSRTDQLLAELQTLSTLDLAMLAVANRQLRAMVDS
ncbi:MAG: NAD-glutamate dehydrogenase, partial [Alphaproteobacteria bacterium]